MQHLHDSMNNLWEEADQLYNEICEDEAGERAEVAERGHFVRYLAAYGYTEEEQQALFARVALGERVPRERFRESYTAFISDLAAVNKAIQLRATDAELRARGVPPELLPAFVESLLDAFAVSAAVEELTPLLASRWEDILRARGFTLQACEEVCTGLGEEVLDEQVGAIVRAQVEEIRAEVRKATDRALAHKGVTDAMTKDVRAALLQGEAEAVVRAAVVELTRALAAIQGGAKRALAQLACGAELERRFRHDRVAEQAAPRAAPRRARARRRRAGWGGALRAGAGQVAEELLAEVAAEVAAQEYADALRAAALAQAAAALAALLERVALQAQTRSYPEAGPPGGEPPRAQPREPRGPRGAAGGRGGLLWRGALLQRGRRGREADLVEARRGSGAARRGAVRRGRAGVAAGRGVPPLARQGAAPRGQPGRGPGGRAAHKERGARR